MMFTGTNLWDAQQTVDSIMEDFPPGLVAELPQQQQQTIHSALSKHIMVDYDGYCKIDKHELEHGQKVGKPREKVVDVQEMLQLAK